MLESHITEQILAAFFVLYRDLGYGFLETVYVNALLVELQRRGLRVERERSIEVMYQGVAVGAYRCDLIVEGRVMVEIKSTPTLADIHERQLLNYLKASSVEVGMLLHFGPTPHFRRKVYSNERKHHNS